MRKCCPMNFDFVNRTCVPSENDFLHKLNFAFEFLIGWNCSNGMNHILLLASDMSLPFSIVQSGDLEIVNNLTKAATLVVKPENYCLDFIDGDQSGLSVLVCLRNEDNFVVEMVYGKFEI